LRALARVARIVHDFAAVPVRRPASVELQREERGMHKIAIPSYAIERALARRGRLHPFEDLDPARTALVVVDLQNGFMVPGQPAEIAQAREIVPAVNRLARATRAAGGTVVWIQNTITPESEQSWSVWLGNFADDHGVRACGKPSHQAISATRCTRTSTSCPAT
jgi:Isochorismatase family